MLKNFKKKLAQEEESFERLKKDYPHLANMNESAILSYLGIASRFDVMKYVEGLGTKVIPEMQTGAMHCNCFDSNGDTKYLYMNRKEVELALGLRQKRQHNTLSIYACPTSTGWYLTKE